MKHRLLAKRYWNDCSTPMGSLDKLAGTASDIIDLSLGDPDIVTDSRITNAAFADALAGHTKYTDFRGYPELRQAISDFYREDYGMEVHDGEIFVSVGACIAMYLVLEAMLDPGDEVIIQAPYFTPYKQQIELAGGVPVELAANENDGFQIDFDLLSASVTARTRAFILNTPSNPSGCVISVSNMERLADFAISNDITIIADDIYTALSFASPFKPIASIERIRDRVVTINSFSKNFAMTGWRLGCIIADPVLIDTIKNINENMAFTACSVSQRAGIYALKHRNELTDDIASEFKKRVFYAAQRINSMQNISVMYPPQGTFYLFANIKQTGLTSADVCHEILEKAHVLVIPGTGFGKSCEGYIRICCTTCVDRLCEAFDRLEKLRIFGGDI